MSPALDLPEIAFFGRRFAEYLSFFGLDAARLAGRHILDCAAGPSSFAAEAQARGLHVTALDPRYNRTENALRQAALSDHRRVFDQLRARPGLVEAGTFASLDEAERDRGRAVELFLADYYAGLAQGRYLPGALPGLPLRDAAFDTVLCAHFLFTYEQLLPLAFHVAACRELCRVAAREVRVHPLVNAAGEVSPWLEPVRAALAADGISGGIIDVEYAFFRGANQTLVLHPPAGARRGGRKGERAGTEATAPTLPRSSAIAIAPGRHQAMT